MGHPGHCNLFEAATFFNHNMPTDQDTGKRRECTTIERVRVIEFYAQGLSHRAIAKKAEIPRTTVQRVIQEWVAQQKLKADSRSGCPITLNFRDKRRLYRLSDANPYATLSEIMAAPSLNISASTAGRILRASGRRVRYARNKPFISAVSRQKRVCWARSQWHLTSVQWRKRVFTDEIHIELSPRGMFVKLFNAKICTSLIRSTSSSPPASKLRI